MGSSRGSEIQAGGSLLGNTNKVHHKVNPQSGLSAKDVARAQHIGPYTRGHLDKLCKAITEGKTLGDALKTASPKRGKHPSTQQALAAMKIRGALHQKDAKETLTKEWQRVQEDRQTRKLQRAEAKAAATKKSTSETPNEITFQLIREANTGRPYLQGVCKNRVVIKDFTDFEGKHLKDITVRNSVSNEVLFSGSGKLSRINKFYPNFDSHGFDFGITHDYGTITPLFNTINNDLEFTLKE